MPVDAKLFNDLFRQLLKMDFWGTAPPKPPYKIPPSAKAVQRAIAQGADILPPLYRDAYVKPLLNNLDLVVASLRQQGEFHKIESLSGAVYQHAQHEVWPQLGRFLAVISNLYRSFLSSKRRARAQFPLVETLLPPLAMFQHQGRWGPFTLASDQVLELCGSSVAVVSLPATYRDHPVVWALLAHETGGHDVVKADPLLLPELRSGVRAMFRGGLITTFSKVNFPQLMGLLWAYWMNEAVSDVYGVLNIGPSFGLNLAVFLAALNAAETRRAPTPRLLTRSSSIQEPPKRLDPHPTEILRLHLILGAVESLQSLAEATRNAYAADLRALAELCAPDATKVEIHGSVPVRPGVRMPVHRSLPLADMQDAARRVGAFIATATLKALGEHRIQELETWDDADEETAVHIAAELKSGRPVAGLGDDAQLLAGATLALCDQPSRYQQVNQLLGQALDLSFAQDPFWSKSQPGPKHWHGASIGGGESRAARRPGSCGRG